MSIEEFVEWLSIFKTAFPDDERLGTLGVSWYPGVRDRQYEDALDDARTVGQSDKTWVFVANRNPSDRRIRILVQNPGEAHFWMDPIELDESFEFSESELQAIRDLLARQESEIRNAWKRFKELATESQARWAAKLGVRR